MSLNGIRDHLSRAALMFDFDGTLAPIVARPKGARVNEGLRDVLARLIPRAASVAVVTGCPASFVRRQMPIPGVRVIGLYGLAGAPPIDGSVRRAVKALVTVEPGVTVEDKSVTLVLHTRNTAVPSVTES